MKKINLFLIAVLISSVLFSQTWTALTSGTTNSLLGFHFMDDNFGYVVGGSGTILKTTNGGSSWFSQSSGTINNLYSVCFINPNTGYAVGDNGTALVTVNGGNSWSPVTLSTTLHLRMVYFFDSNNGYITGVTTGSSSGIILKTTNGGLSWTSTSTSNSIYNIFFTDINTGYACGWNNTILKTTNAGSSWTAQTSPVPANLFYICFTDTNNGYICGSEGTILKTTNAGSTWTAQNSGCTDYLTSIKFLDANTGFAVGGNVSANTSTILKTHDAGITWVSESSSSSRQFAAFFPGFNAGYTCGLGGTILKITGINAGINDAQVPNNFNVVTSPNPFSNSLQVTFDLQKNEVVTVQLVDVLGKECSPVFTGEQQGNHQIKIDNLISLSNGIYFVKVQIGDVIQTKQVIKAQ